MLVGDQEVGWQWQPCAPVRCRGGSVGPPLPGLRGHGRHRHRVQGGAAAVALQSVIPALCQCGPESARRPPRRLPTVPLAAQTPSEPAVWTWFTASVRVPARRHPRSEARLHFVASQTHGVERELFQQSARSRRTITAPLTYAVHTLPTGARPPTAPQPQEGQTLPKPQLTTPPPLTCPSPCTLR